MTEIPVSQNCISRDIENISLHEFQQPINCCNITSLAYALSALGYSTTVDDIFYTTRLPIASVLDDGMTLAETYDTCLRYVEKEQLPLHVRVEHFDKPNLTFESFRREVEAAVANENDIHIFNFSVGIAHDNPNLKGGHFSLLADYDSGSTEVVIADTNPKKYTRFWRCPIRRMYDACVDKDSSSIRARGMIVITCNK